MNHRQINYDNPSNKLTDPYKNELNNNNNLQGVISKYQTNPELLKLILASKVEEDRRRTEEAKLKSKELDLYLNQQKDKTRRASFGNSSNCFRRIVPYETATITSTNPSLSTRYNKYTKYIIFSHVWILSAPIPKRRRSIQAVSKIIETHGFPLNDGFFWKNNGNTLQKKTGRKSIYYKCANKVSSISDKFGFLPLHIGMYGE